MLRNQQVVRMLKIIEILSRRGKGITLNELANEMNVNRRTIYRDIDALQEAGFPIVDNEVGEKEKYWSFVDGYRYQIPIPFGVSEVIGLYFCRGLLDPLKNTVFEESLAKAMQKIRSSLSSDILEFVDRIEEAFSAKIQGGINYKDYHHIIKLLNQSVLNLETVHLIYKSYSQGSRPTKRLIDPYKIYYYQGTLYLIGYCHKNAEVRTFAVERIQSATKTGHCFKLPASFSIQEYFKDSFGVFRQELQKVVIQFDKKVAPYIRSRLWHESQEIEEGTRGSVILTCYVSGTREIKSWIMGFADHAKVIEPDYLAQEIVSDIQNMLDQYKEPQVQLIPITRKASS